MSYLEFTVLLYLIISYIYPPARRNCLSLLPCNAVKALCRLLVYCTLVAVTVLAFKLVLIVLIVLCICVYFCVYTIIHISSELICLLVSLVAPSSLLLFDVLWFLFASLSFPFLRRCLRRLVL